LRAEFTLSRVEWAIDVKKWPESIRGVNHNARAAPIAPTPSLRSEWQLQRPAKILETVEALFYDVDAGSVA
jgi:hypothetical protein